MTTEENCEPDAETMYMEKVVNTMHDVSIPDISSAFILNHSPDGKQCTIATKWSQKNYEISKSDGFTVVYNYDKSVKQLTRISTPLEANKVLLESFSPSLKLRAVIKKHVEEKSTKDQYILEIWSITRRIKTINLTSFEKHGQVHSDALFGSLCWSKDESKIVYVAEKKKPKTNGYFERTQTSSSSCDKPIQGDEYNYEESWGEQLTDVINTVLCVYTLAEDSLKVVEGIQDNLCPFQPAFGSTSDVLIFSAFQTSPFRLGAIYCENRVSGIYLVNLQNDVEAVELSKSDTLNANFHPYVNKSGTKLAFIQRPLSGTGDPHRDCVSLILYSFVDISTRILTNEIKHDGKTFSLFVMGKNINFNLWLPDNTHIAIPNTLEGKNYVCIIDTDTAMLKSMVECSDFLGMHEGIFLASFNSLNSENSTLMVMDFNDPANPVVTKEPLEIDDNVETGSIVDEHGIVSFYLMPKTACSSKGSFPLFVTPHGGPHSTFMKYYSRNARLFCKLGYAVLLVNYRGSTGFTDESLRSLPGNVGTQDVKDVQGVVNQFISLKTGLIDMENIFICGGSHGGFLGAHLIGQFPDFYRAACLRNPVIEISSMSVQSDIPDWTYFESGLHYTQDLVLSKDASSSMLSKSPVNYVSNVKAPVLLCIGGKDARVPPDQGKYYFRLLKANNKVVKMLFYPNDCHPLSTVETDGDNTLNICKWFYQHGTHSR